MCIRWFVARHNFFLLYILRFVPEYIFISTYLHSTYAIYYWGPEWLSSLNEESRIGSNLTMLQETLANKVKMIFKNIFVVIIIFAENTFSSTNCWNHCRATKLLLATLHQLIFNFLILEITTGWVKKKIIKVV